jgi:hypothetical protein
MKTFSSNPVGQEFSLHSKGISQLRTSVTPFSSVNGGDHDPYMLCVLLWSLIKSISIQNLEHGLLAKGVVWTHSFAFSLPSSTQKQPVETWKGPSPQRHIGWGRGKKSRRTVDAAGRQDGNALQTQGGHGLCCLGRTKSNPYAVQWPKLSRGQQWPWHWNQRLWQGTEEGSARPVAWLHAICVMLCREGTGRKQGRKWYFTWKHDRTTSLFSYRPGVPSR